MYEDKSLGGCKVGNWETDIKTNKRSIDEYNVSKKDQEFIKFLQKCKFVIEHDPNLYSKKTLVLRYKNFYDVLSVDLTEFNN